MSASDPKRKRLPVKPSQENLRKQAKRLARSNDLPLSEAQHQLAQQYGARTWAELMHIVQTMLRGADQLAYVKYDMEALPLAANQSDLTRVRDILASGEFTQHDLDLALARSVLRFGERAQIAKLLLEHGADPDGQYGSNYGPIVFVTGECLDVDGLQFLIDAGADVKFEPIDTKYGRQCPLSTWLGTYLRGRNDAKHRGVEILLKHGACVPQEVTPQLLAIHRDDARSLGQLLDADPALATRRFESLPYTDVADLTLLHYACEFGESECIESLIGHGADVNARSRNGVTPMHCAARGGTRPIVVRLLDAGARQWLADDTGKEPRQYAKESQVNPHRHAILDVLTTLCIDDPNFDAALAAIDAGEVERLKQILNDHPYLAKARLKSASAITRGYFTEPTLLHFVAGNPTRNDNAHLPPRILESTKAILNAGAEVDASTHHMLGGTTLALVASSGPAHEDNLVTPLLELLVTHGANPAEGFAAALIHRFVDTARTLLRLGASHTLLSAAGLGDVPITRQRLNHATESERVMAAWAAVINGQNQTLELLIHHGTDVNARLPRPDQITLLHEAAWFGHRDICQRLLSLGADPTIRDTQYGGTPARWARHAGHIDLSQWLEDVLPG